jgi:D-alanyl-D-alanine carboxypeptidase
MMTAYTILALVDQLKLNLNTELVCISEEAAHVQGTSADLAAGDYLTMY